MKNIKYLIILALIVTGAYAYFHAKSKVTTLNNASQHIVVMNSTGLDINLKQTSDICTNLNLDNQTIEEQGTKDLSLDLNNTCKIAPNFSAAQGVITWVLQSAKLNSTITYTVKKLSPQVIKVVSFKVFQSPAKQYSSPEPYDNNLGSYNIEYYADKPFNVKKN